MLLDIKGVIPYGLQQMFNREAALNFYCVLVHYDLEDLHRKEEIIVRGEEDLKRILKATLELHFEPGINPVNKEKTAPAFLIAVAPFSLNGPYWWSTPGLQENNDPKGAYVYTMVGFDAVWARPGVEIPPSWGYKTK